MRLGSRQLDGVRPKSPGGVHGVKAGLGAHALQEPRPDQLHWLLLLAGHRFLAQVRLRGERLRGAGQVRVRALHAADVPAVDSLELYVGPEVAFEELLELLRVTKGFACSRRRPRAIAAQGRPEERKARRIEKEGRGDEEAEPASSEGRAPEAAGGGSATDRQAERQQW